MESMTELEMLVGALIQFLALVFAWAIYPFVVGGSTRRN